MDRRGAIIPTSSGLTRASTRQAAQLGLYAAAYIIEAARAQRVPLLALDWRLRQAAAELGLEVWEITP